VTNRGKKQERKGQNDDKIGQTERKRGMEDVRKEGRENWRQGGGAEGEPSRRSGQGGFNY
jgi:hypothetical protein